MINKQESSLSIKHPGEDPLLNIKNLSVEFRVGGEIIRAVNDISLHVNRRESVAIVGESGSGKSVTALSVLGLLRTPPAFITFNTLSMSGDSIPFNDVHSMRNIRGRLLSMVFQDPMRSLNPVMSIGSQLIQVMKANGIGGSNQDLRKRAIEMLERVRFPDANSRVDDFPHEFSGGMRQRILIAMAISCEPELLIADEPTTALDVTVQAQIIALLKKIQHELAMSVILITHNLGLVAGFADRVHVMYAGRMVENGPVETVLETPFHPYTRALLNSIPTQHRSKGALKAIPGIPPEPTEIAPGCPFEPRCPKASSQCLQVPPLVKISPNHTAKCWDIDDFGELDPQGDASK